MFTTDNRTEKYLDRCGVKVIYRDDVHYDELDPEWNNKNHGRPKSQQKIATAIDTYAEQMMDGSAAPAVVLHKTRAGLDVLDGIQRLNANAICEHTRFTAYVVECSPETAMKIRICINNRLSGVAQNPMDFAIEQMVDLFMIKGTESASDVATFVGRSKSDVEKHYERAVARNRVTSLYSDGAAPPDLKLAIYDCIATNSEPDDFEGRAGDVVRKFLGVLEKCKFKNGDAEHFTQEFFGVKRIGSKKRDVQFNSKLQTIKRNPIVKTKLSGRRVSTSIENMQRHFKTLNNCVKDHKGAEIDNEDIVAAFNDSWRDIGRMLREQCTSEIRRKIDPFN